MRNQIATGVLVERETPSSYNNQRLLFWEFCGPF